MIKNKEKTNLTGRQPLPPLTVRFLGEKELAEHPKKSTWSNFSGIFLHILRYFGDVVIESGIISKNIAALALIIIGYGIIPVLLKKTFFNTGSFIIIAIGMFFVWAAFWVPRILKGGSQAAKRLAGFVCMCACMGFVVLSAVSGMMLSASMKSIPEYKSRVTVIVLGCQVNGNQPSLMLQGRLDKAYEFLSAHPEAYCITSGGQGEHEDFAEGDIMRDYLINKGISPKRIIAETKSTDTYSNLKNSAVTSNVFHNGGMTGLIDDRGGHQNSIIKDNVGSVYNIKNNYWEN